ncbi:diacylglycerol/lipid kinase family protein, partial [Cellulosimicrobium cellulans]|uniref:diacylglycerol/lipid kinase family protein n=1 Tax=Cellulosimicrobium cellulans TaxID=1710 RepID=UPI0008488879
MSTVGLVVNPTAGRGRGAAAGARTADALRAAGHDVLHLGAPSLPLAQESADTAVRGDHPVDALVVVGGDGMVHLGVNAVAGTGVPLGVVAVGTGNDFAHALDLPTRAVDPCVDALLHTLDHTDHARERRVDAARVTGAHLPGPRWYAGVLSAGVDAAVTAHANAATWPRGRSRYARSALREISRYRPYGYRVTLDGVQGPDGDDPPALVAGVPVTVEPGPDGAQVVWRSPGALVAVANTPRFGGGIRIAPGARLDDGLLDVVLAGALTRADAARTFPGMYAGRHLRHPGVGALRARAVTL